LKDVYPGVEREDEMVAAFDYCLHGKGGAAPSIDTAMHALVDAPHVDHLHRDSGIALATAADGERLTREWFGDAVVWVPWRRPGFQLGLDIAEIKAQNPGTIGCVLGGHGITAWGETSQEARDNSLRIIRAATEFSAARGDAEARGAHDAAGAELRPQNPGTLGCVLGGHGITAWGETSQEARDNSLRIIREATEFIEARGDAEPFGAHDPSGGAAGNRAAGEGLGPVPGGPR